MRPLVKRQRSHPEAELQISLVSFLRTVLPLGSIVHGSLNEEPDKVRRMLNAAMGAMPGFSDILIIAGRRHLYVEIKTASGRQSESQTKFQRLIEAQGFPYVVVRSIDECLAAMDRHGIPTRIVSPRGTPWQSVRLEPSKEISN